MRGGRFELITHFDVCTESWFWEKLKIFYRGGAALPPKGGIVASLMGRGGDPGKSSIRVFLPIINIFFLNMRGGVLN